MDGLNDFEIIYYRESVSSGSSYERVVGYIESFGKNRVLAKNQCGILFLKDLNEITENVNDPLIWSCDSCISEIISINNNLEREWPPQWKLHNEEERESYFIGLKLISETEIKIGWVELDFNLNTGQTILINTGIL